VVGFACGHLGGVTVTSLPNCWSWPDQDDCDHWVVEGTALGLDKARRPTVTTLCGQQVPVCAWHMRRVYGNHCHPCHEKLTDMIAAALD
jgi:hypothetical protein